MTSSRSGTYTDPYALYPSALRSVWGAAYVLKEWPYITAYANAIDFEKLPLPSEQLKGYAIPLPLEDVPAERYTMVGQDDLIRLGNEELRVLFVPGHAPGHLAYYAPESGILLSGDTLLQGTIGRTDFWYGSYEQLVESIRTQYLPLPDETIVFSGHGPETTIGYERRQESFPPIGLPPLPQGNLLPSHSFAAV